MIPYYEQSSGTSTLELFYTHAGTSTLDCCYYSDFPIIDWMDRYENECVLREEMYKKNRDHTIIPVPRPQRVWRMNPKKRRRYNYFGVT